MIAHIEGRLHAKEERAVIIRVGGLGLRVRVPDTFLERCGPVGSTVLLYTYLHVREADLSLYGCATKDELQLFEQLLGVSGVGPKVGLSLLSNLSADRIRQAIVTEQVSILSSVPGIGTRTAQKIILDLKDKVAALVDVSLPPPAIVEADAEVIAALTTLGYSVIEAQSALQHVSPSVEDIEERLRAALAYLGS
jgi:Holliday junction DNA helicase RuvA